MGPRFFNRGNDRRSAGGWAVLPASMGPRFFNRGNFQPFPTLDVPHTGFNGAAVFQPRKLAPANVSAWHVKASMGPRFFNRGNSPNVDTQVNGGNGLQWGRGFSTAETRPTSTPR